MLKSNEWGAVAYLTQSIYGRCSNATTCRNIGINNNSGYITGYGASASAYTDATNGTYTTSLGQNASTTGNIYGIYDMSGGTYEYVMGNYDNKIGNSGFSNLPEVKYYNTYTGTSYQGHALSETSGWYGDHAYFVDSNASWFVRGGLNGSNTSGGMFRFNYGNGSNDGAHGFRLAVVK